MSDGDDLIVALRPVAEAFRRLGVRFYVGGSVASTFHGAIRSTMDVDLVCDLAEADVASFAESFGEEFYISLSAVQQAVQRKSCFNLIHLPTSYKIDVFVNRGRPFDLAAMDRANDQDIIEGAGLTVPIATVEDSIVAKLERFRMTNETSERQWDDVSKMVALHEQSLDVEQMRSMAESIGVGDLLAKLLAGRWPTSRTSEKRR